jgi:predicted ATPase/class 3 adenylate cyclase
VSRPALPTGTVTFLFTDVEASTRLLAEHGDRYAELLDEHRRLLRAAFTANEGVEVDTQGDAFFVAFARASDALAAAERAQRALARTPVSVRMGLHTGEPQLTGEGYVGMDVHRAARIAAAGHGGQVLVSEQTARLLDGAALRDLGVHRLKDVGDARIFQLGGDDFPPLRTLYQTNLPVPAHPLVGRKKELVDVVRMLAVERARVVTLTGPGGIGKTRFSLAAASEVTEAFADGVWFVDLSPVREGALVIPAVASALGAEAALPIHIGHRELLIVLDNLEQVVAAAPELAALIGACPGLQLLATSREPLHIAPEREYALRPLPESPAVELFRQRARAAVANGEVDYEVAAAICERLDRLPLAIELAAARVKVLDPPALLERLDRSLPLLASRSRDLPERQRTLHSTIAWSYDLLTPEERRLFRRLAVFAGGWTLAAAEAVCDADLDLLESLVDKSLLRRSCGRFVMLETIREYAVEQLDGSDEAEAIRRRHAEFFLELALSAGLAVEVEVEQRHDLVLADQDNMRTAIDWAFAAGDRLLAVEIAVALENFWVSSSPAEADRRFGELLAGGEIPDVLRGRALRVWGSAVGGTGDTARARELLEASKATFEALGDEFGRALVLPRLTSMELMLGNLDRAEAMTNEALTVFRARGFRKGEVPQLGLLGEIACRRGDLDRGLSMLLESAAAAEEIGFRWWHAGGLISAAEHAAQAGRNDDAERWAREALPVLHTIGFRAAAVMAVGLLATLAAERGEGERAGTLWGVVEAEVARTPMVAWEQDRAAYEAAVLALGGEAFERARSAGRQLLLDEAVEAAIAGA